MQQVQKKKKKFARNKINTLTNHQGNSPVKWLIKLEMILLNQLQKLSSRLYNYLQSIKSFVVKISTHRKCCELIIPKVPGMSDKKASNENYLRSIPFKRNYIVL